MELKEKETFNETCQRAFILEKKLFQAKSFILENLKINSFAAIDDVITKNWNKKYVYIWGKIGDEVLEWALVYNYKIEPLNFLIKHKEQLSLERILSQHKKIIEHFLMYIIGEIVFGERSSDSKWQENTIAKFYDLLKIDETYLLKFLNDNEIKNKYLDPYPFIKTELLDRALEEYNNLNYEIKYNIKLNIKNRLQP